MIAPRCYLRVIIIRLRHAGRIEILDLMDKIISSGGGYFRSLGRKFADIAPFTGNFSIRAKITRILYYMRENVFTL